MTAITSSPPKFVEPTRALPLRWGNYTARYVIALVLLWAGPILGVASIGIGRLTERDLIDGEFPTGLLIGYLLFVSGWIIVPAQGWRRTVAAIVGFVALIVYFHTLPIEFGALSQMFGLAGGPLYYFSEGAFPAVGQGLAITAVLAVWFLVRQRSGWSFLLLIAALPIVVVLAMAGVPAWSTDGGFFVAAIDLIIRYVVPETLLFAFAWALLLGGFSWLARGAIEVAVSPARREYRRNQQETIHAARTVSFQYAQAEQIKQWQAASAQVPEGQPGSVPAVPQLNFATERTNVLAILSLVFAFIVPLLGAIFGHVARSQISRTGERGTGLALGGIIVSYLSIAISMIATIAYVATLQSFLR